MMDRDCQYEELAHTSEIGVRVQASSASELFQCAATALFALLELMPDSNAEVAIERVDVNSADIEGLLVDWLSELVYLHETSGLTLAACTVNEWLPQRILATVSLAPPLGPPTMHIKAVTYHQLCVAETDTGWVAEVYFDI